MSDYARLSAAQQSAALKVYDPIDQFYSAYLKAGLGLDKQSFRNVIYGGGSFASEAVLVFAAMQGTPTGFRKVLINAFITTLISAGIWAKLDRLFVLAAPTSQDALINWKTPQTADAILLLTPTFVADRGFTTNGVDNAVDLNFNPATAGGNLATDSACFGFRTRTAGQTTSSVAGWFDATDGISLHPRNASDNLMFRINQAASSTITTTIADGRGFHVANRSGAAATQVYKNGVALTVATNPNQASTALNSNTLYIGRLATATFMATEFASAVIGGSLTAQEHATLAAAELAYMQAVGAA